MIASMVLILHKLENGADHKIYPYFIHSWIYSRIQHTQIGQYYHESEKTAFAMKHILRDQQGNLSIQLIFFDYRVLLEFYRSLTRGEKIRLGSSFYLIESCPIHPEEHPKAGLVSYDSFCQLPVSKKITMKFNHTAFNHDHKTIVLPIPENIVGSILRKWNQTSGQLLTSDNDAELIHKLASGMLITSHNIGTKLYYIRSDIRLTTFSGRVTIENTHQDPDLRQLLNALLHFSTYSGIGWKCSYGMGSIEVLPCAGKQEHRMDRKEVFSF